MLKIRYAKKQGAAVSPFPQGLFSPPKVRFYLKTRVLRRRSSRRGFFSAQKVCCSLKTRVLRRRGSRRGLFSAQKVSSPGKNV